MESPERKRRLTAFSDYCLAVIAVILVFFVLSHAASVGVPFMLAFLLAMLFFPLMKWGVGRRVPTMLMVIVVMLVLVAVIFPIWLLLSSRVQAMINGLPPYYMKLVEIGKDLLERFDIPRDILGNVDWTNTIGRYISNTAGSMINWLSSMVMVLVFLVFMLLESPTVDKRLRNAFNGSAGERIIKIAGSIVSQISKYLRTLAVISLATGICVAVALSIIKVDFAISWGILAFFLNFIPTLGSIVASVPPVLIAVVQFYPEGWPAIITALSLLSIQFLIGNILTPKIMGDTLDLSPVVILLSLLCWGLIWGIAGALLSVPILVMIKIICENIPSLNFIAKMICSSKGDIGR